MHTAKRFSFVAALVVLSASLIAQAPSRSAPETSAKRPAAGLKTGEERGELIGPAVDCDGDGDRNDMRIDFDGDNRPDECVEDRELIPEPPFEQTYTPSSDDFYSRLPAVGWSARYQCGDGLYEITLTRPEENSVVYSSEGLTISEPVNYDDLDPNLNHPLIVQDPVDGIRYSFEQSQGNEFYEYAIADYGGDVGLYVYQTGEQIVATPCEVAGQVSEINQTTSAAPQRIEQKTDEATGSAAKVPQAK